MIKDPIQNPQPPVGAIHGVLLNHGVLPQLPPATLDALMPAFEELVATNGGPFRSNFGECELKIMVSTDHAMFGLKLDGQSIALAILAWEDFAADILWEELLKAHRRLVAPDKAPVELVYRPVPDQIPWLGVTMSPMFLSSAETPKIAVALAAIWVTAYALLAKHRGCAKNN